MYFKSGILFFIIYMNLCEIDGIDNNIEVFGKTLYRHVELKNHLRNTRQIKSLYTNIKLNKQYQQCNAPGDKTGHCRHMRFCPMDGGILKNTRFIDYLCVIGNSVVGICCPDDLIIGSPSAGANIVPNLPADGYEEIEDEEEAKSFRRSCGMKSLSQRSHAGSRQTELKEWPWMAALLEYQSTLFCGAVLITDQHVLSAAHCTNTRLPANIFVRLGEYDLSRVDETRALDFTVADIIQHADFDQSTYDNDIAVIKLSRRTTFNSYIWPICLPPVNLEFVNVTATVTGWGRQDFDGANTSNILMEVSMPVWDHDKCEKSFTQTITKNVLCAAAYEGGKDSCQGDSGGPLQYQLDNGRWVNIGVVSWGIRCGVPGRPGVYTRVNKYLNWIVDNTVY